MRGDVALAPESDFHAGVGVNRTRMTRIAADLRRSFSVLSAMIHPIRVIRVPHPRSRSIDTSYAANTNLLTPYTQVKIDLFIGPCRGLICAGRYPEGDT